MVVAKKIWVKFARTSETRGVGMKIIKKDGTLTKKALTFGNGALRFLTYPEQEGKIKLPACYINEFRYREFFDKFRVSYELKDEMKFVNRGAKRAVVWHMYVDKDDLELAMLRLKSLMVPPMNRDEIESRIDEFKD